MCQAAPDSSPRAPHFSAATFAPGRFISNESKQAVFLSAYQVWRSTDRQDQGCTTFLFAAGSVLNDTTKVSAVAMGGGLSLSPTHAINKSKVEIAYGNFGPVSRFQFQCSQ